MNIRIQLRFYYKHEVTVNIKYLLCNILDIQTFISPNMSAFLRSISAKEISDKDKRTDTCRCLIGNL